MKMTDHQRQLWKDMINLIESYLNNPVDFYKLVGNLEGTLDALESTNTEIINQRRKPEKS